MVASRDPQAASREARLPTSSARVASPPAPANAALPPAHAPHSRDVRRVPTRPPSRPRVSIPRNAGQVAPASPSLTFPVPVDVQSLAAPRPARASYPVRPALGALLVLVAVSMLANSFDALRGVVWVLAVLVAGGAALLCAATAVRNEHRTHQSYRWQAQATSATLLMLALMAMSGGAPTRDGALLLMGAAVALVVTSLLRLESPRWRAQAVLLLLDAAIVAASVALGAVALFGTGYLGSPLIDLLPAGNAAAAYAVLIATRRSALLDPRGPDALLLVSSLLAVVYGFGVCALLEFDSPLGAFAAPGVALMVASVLALSAWRGLSEPQVRPLVHTLATSRLRFAPALAAVFVIALLTLAELTGGATRIGFLGVTTLFALILARMVYTLFENRQLVRHVERSGVFEEQLRELGVSLIAAFDRKEALSLVARTAHLSFGADAVLLWMLDHTTDEIEIAEVQGAKRPSMLGRRIPNDDPSSLVARVARTGESEIVAQVSNAASTTNRFLNVLLGSQSLLGVPIKPGDSIQGVLVLVDTHRQNAYTRQDLAKAELLASQVAVALDNAYQHDLQRRRLEEVTALYQFAQSAHTATSAPEIASQMLPILKERLRYTYAAVWVRDHATDTLRLAAGDSPGGVPQAGVRPSELAAHAFHTGQSIHAGLGWVVASEDYQPPRSGIKSQLAVPMLLKQRVVGVIDLESRQLNAYSLNDERLLVLLANHAALAVENLQLIEANRKVETLRELDRMKSELLSTVSHELRTPLGSIKGYATTLLTHEAKLDPEERREFLEIIDSEADRLRELIENLLDLSRIEAGVLRIEPARARLGPLMREVARKVQLAAPDHQVEIDWPSDREVVADTRRVYQVVQNLLTNAVKYSPGGGRIRLTGAYSRRELRVSVGDEGLGLPPRELDRIFDRFHRVGGEVSSRVGGTGLGLAICKALVDAHGGRIWAESEGEGCGSTFHFTVPCS